MIDRFEQLQKCNHDSWGRSCVLELVKVHERLVACWACLKILCIICRFARDGPEDAKESVTPSILPVSARFIGESLPCEEEGQRLEHELDALNTVGSIGGLCNLSSVWDHAIGLILQSKRAYVETCGQNP